MKTASGRCTGLPNPHCNCQPRRRRSDRAIHFASDNGWRDLRGSNPSDNFAILRKYASFCVLLRTLILRDAQENAQT